MPCETDIARHFARLGARFQLHRELSRRGWLLDIVHDEEGPAFALRVDDELRASLEVIVPNVDRATRHLVLLVRERPDAPLHRFLCGHDEREWFIASVPGGVTTVTQAMEALKPARVRRAQSAAGLKRKLRNRRHNPAFLRQGEWFFVPAPRFDVAGRPIHRWEPIRRGSGKAHLVEEVVRLGGRVVYTFGRQVMLAAEFEKYRQVVGEKSAAHWRSGMRDARVFGRGRVRHSDHATLHLNGWHEVLPNTEAQASITAQRRLAFID